MARRNIETIVVGALIVGLLLAATVSVAQLLSRS